MPFEKVEIVEGLKPLEKIMSGFGAHLADHVEEVDIAVDSEKGLGLQISFGRCQQVGVLIF